MEKLMYFVLRNRMLMSVLCVLVLAAGYYSYKQLPVDAFPDVTPNLVQVFTETEGLAPEEVEKYVTFPVETAMSGLPGLKEIRSVSNFGLSVINIYFEDSMDIYFARQLVNERLQQAREEIPEGFGEPAMGPISTGLGQILFFVLEDESGKRTPEEMREIQDWLVKFNLQTVPGVTEVLSLGGEVKQFHVRIRPHDLLRYNLSLPDIIGSVKANNSNVGAQFIVKNGEEYIVRSVGLAEKIADLNSIVLKSESGTPVLLQQVADVVIGGEVRRGLATMNGKGEAVVGMVLKLIGTNTSTVIGDVKAKIAEINKTLPLDIKLIAYYDQAALVKKCIGTVTKALVEAVILIIIIQLAMLGGFRPSIVVLSAIPFSLAFAFLLMKYSGLSANLMSLGGLAIALGLLVDGAVVMVENIDRHMRDAEEDEPFIHIVARACMEVARPILFSLLIIVIVFLPLFSLQGVEGKTFRPLAQTMSFAMFGSLIFAMLVVPVLSSMLMKRPNHGPGGHKEVFVLRWLLKLYQPAVTWFVQKPAVAIMLAVSLIVIGGFVFTLLGSEFVPRLNEGDLLVRATMAPSISIEEARDNMLRFERRLMSKFPEVTRVVTRVGRGEVGAHADPVNSAEAFVAMKPKDEWTSAKSLEELYSMMSEEFEDFPGAQFNFTQPIAAAVDELLTGTKADLAIKIFGPDMEVLKEKAEEVEEVIRGVSGAADVQKAMDAKVKLPPGYITTWGGQFKLQQEANKRLSLVIPVTFLIVFLLLYSSFSSMKNTFLILLNIPLALVGGVIGLWITGQNLSVPASVGFIALFGIALANGMVLVTYFNQLLREGIPVAEACIKGASLRLRPVLMTASAAAFGLVPMVLSSGTGSEVQRPLATVVIGGLVTSTILTLLVIPALYKWFAIDPEEETVMK